MLILMLSARRADEVLRIVCTAYPGVLRDLGMRAQRARHFGSSSCCGTRCYNLRRRFALFSPAFDRAEKLRLIRTDAAAAMPHAGHQEQPHPTILRIAAQFLTNRRNVIDRVFRRRTWIGPAVVKQQLSAARFE